MEGEWGRELAVASPGAVAALLTIFVTLATSAPENATTTLDVVSSLKIPERCLARCRQQGRCDTGRCARVHATVAHQLQRRGDDERWSYVQQDDDPALAAREMDDTHGHRGGPARPSNELHATRSTKCLIGSMKKEMTWQNGHVSPIPLHFWFWTKLVWY